MDDLALIKELLPLLQAGGDLGLIVAVFLLFKAWQLLQGLDRRVMRLEIHLGLDPAIPAPKIAANDNAPGGARRMAPLAAVVLAIFLGGCTPTMLLGAAYLLQGRSAVQVNAGDYKAGVTLTLPKTAVPFVQPSSAADPD